MPVKKKSSRVKQPSTYAGLAGIGQALAFAFPAHAVAIQAVSAAAAALAVYLHESPPA